jgi:hypothetical protein
MWWRTPAIPRLRRLRQEDYEIKASLGCTARLCVSLERERERKRERE